MIRVGTRGSALARAQADLVVGKLRAATPGEEFVVAVLATSGDQDRSVPLGTGVFVREIQQALLRGEIDLAVHSLKDLPTDPAPGLTVAAIPERADPRDALVGAKLADLPAGARVATGSPRRVAQLLRLRPDLQPIPLRGNVPTRIRRVADGDAEAVMVAAAGLARLGLSADDLFDPLVVLPAPGQGALAIETREDSGAHTLVEPLDDASTRAAVTAERAVLRALGGGCMLPVATYGRLVDGALIVHASVTSPDGRRQATASAGADPGDATALGAAVAAQLQAEGAMSILESFGAGPA